MAYSLTKAIHVITRFSANYCKHLRISIVLLFVVCSPEELHVEKTNRDVRFFAKLVQAVHRFLVKGILPKIVGHWYTRQSVI